MYIHGGTDALFPRLCAAIGRPELVDDPRFTTIAGRLEAVDPLEAIVGAWTGARTEDEIEAILADAGVPCAAVADMERVVASPQLRAREMFVEVDHEVLGSLVLTGIPVKLDGTPGTIRSAPPRAGQDTDRILRQVLGLDDDAITALRDAGAI